MTAVCTLGVVKGYCRHPVKTFVFLILDGFVVYYVVVVVVVIYNKRLDDQRRELHEDC